LSGSQALLPSAYSPLETAAGQASVVLTFDVASLADCQARLQALGATCVQPPHDEGFGLVASFYDPEGNQFELVELRYSFQGGGDVP
jgi:predicted enzyme related to lactoylglutathione lyase